MDLFILMEKKVEYIIFLNLKILVIVVIQKIKILKLKIMQMKKLITLQLKKKIIINFLLVNRI